MNTTNFTTQSFEINVLPIIKKNYQGVNLSTLCSKRYSNLALKKKKKKKDLLLNVLLTLRFLSGIFKSVELINFPHKKLKNHNKTKLKSNFQK